ncbi:nuclear receptor coactivator 5-like isoform X2 [Ambystoma mexicanum]|uniref:nuclear receptor coactivator 5-like isoform X2 n=1 Tax=Ambystoma mexicanum TaxID=8296 RepID=UPI0037E7238E
MSSWVKVTRGQTQKTPAIEKSINPYKPYPKSEFSGQDGYSKEFEEVNSFKDLFGQQYNYSSGSDAYYERYQYSQKGAEDQYSKASRREKLYVQFYEQIHKEYTKERPSDCVVVGINKEQTEYATVIGHQLQDHGLVVEMIYLASESGLTRALQEVKNDGSPFCILVEQSNVALSSCTVIMLHESIKITPKWPSRANDEINGIGREAVHRNMPMADALTLVANSFGKIFTERERKERKEIAHKAADLADDYLERELYETYTVPLGIRHLLFLLSEGKYVYREELNSISDYLKTRKNELEGFEQPVPSTEVDNTLYPSNAMAGSSSATHTLSKPPPLLPTPGATPLLGHAPLSQAKPALLGDRPANLPVPGIGAPKGKPPPLLAAPPSKRPGLLGFSPHQPAKRPFLVEKSSGLLPTPDGMESAMEGRLENPPAPLPLLMATDTSKGMMRLMGPRKENAPRPSQMNFNPWSLNSNPYDGAESSYRPSLLGHGIHLDRTLDGAESSWRPSLLGHGIHLDRPSALPLPHQRSAKPKPLMN